MAEFVELFTLFRRMRNHRGQSRRAARDPSLFLGEYASTSLSPPPAAGTSLRAAPVDAIGAHGRRDVELVGAVTRCSAPTIDGTV